MPVHPARTSIRAPAALIPAPPRAGRGVRRRRARGAPPHDAPRPAVGVGVEAATERVVADHGVLGRPSDRRQAERRRAVAPAAAAVVRDVDPAPAWQRRARTRARAGRRAGRRAPRPPGPAGRRRRPRRPACSLSRTAAPYARLCVTSSPPRTCDRSTRPASINASSFAALTAGGPKAIRSISAASRRNAGQSRIGEPVAAESRDDRGVERTPGMPERPRPIGRSEPRADGERLLDRLDRTFGARPRTCGRAGDTCRLETRGRHGVHDREDVAAQVERARAGRKAGRVPRPRCARARGCARRAPGPASRASAGRCA